MKKNVLIIEDDQTHYEEVRKIFQEYDIDVFPSNDNEFKSFAKNLREFGDSKSDVSLEKIRQKISNHTFDFIILDRSFTTQLADTSGLIVEEKILKVKFPNTEICYLSNYPNEQNLHNYIEKDDIISWEMNLYKKVINKLTDNSAINKNMSELQESRLNPTNIIKDDEKKIIIKKTVFPRWLISLIEKERFKFLPSVSFLVDSLIKYMFYLILFLLFVYTPFYISWSLVKYSSNPIKIAEHTFIVFLPFLITCGFYVFYIKSLSPYIKQKPIHVDDFESSSNLLKLTKKLFVSSLISYMFIKLIELLLLEGESTTPSPFSNHYKIDNPLVLFYIVFGFIIILLFYYLYIDKNHIIKSDKSPEKLK